MSMVARQQTHSSLRVSANAKRTRAPYPGFIEPCHPSERDRPPTGSAWLHEIKSDGYRAQVHLRDGKDLATRKQHLKKLLADAPHLFLYADHLEAEGEEVFAHACRMGLEGIVSKRRDAPSRSGRQESWIKTKCTKSASFPIIAFVE